MFYWLLKFDTQLQELGGGGKRKGLLSECGDSFGGGENILN